MRAALYVRVSTTEQALEGYSISAQASLLKKHAESYGYEVFDIYQDAGISGKNIKDRPGLLRLLEDAGKQCFDLVLIWKLSRLSRSLLDLLGIVNTLGGHNIALQSYSEHFDTSTPVGKMLLQLLGSIAEFERNTIIENIKMGLDERFRQGLSKASIPFGYYYSDRKILVDEKKALAVKEVFLRYLTGNSISSLAEYLNTRGFKNRLNNPWTYDSVLHMLKNEFYKGFVRTGRRDLKNSRYEALKGLHDPIIAPETFEAVRKKLESCKKSSYTRRPEAEQLLSGLLRCPLCNGVMYYAESTSNKKGKRYTTPLYRCSLANRNTGGCPGFSTVCKKIDSQVLDIIGELLDPPFLKDIFQVSRKILKNDTKDKLTLVKSKLKETEKSKERYLSLFEAGKLHADLFCSRLTEIDRKIEELLKREKELKNIIDKENRWIKSQEESTISFRNLLGILNPHEKREILSSLVDEVSIGKEKEVYKILLKNGIAIDGPSKTY